MHGLFLFGVYVFDIYACLFFVLLNEKVVQLIGLEYGLNAPIPARTGVGLESSSSSLDASFMS